MDSKISEQRLIELERAERKLSALESGGVDNWDNYDDSLREYYKENEHSEKVDSFISELSCAFGECAYEPSERGAGVAFNDDVYKVIHGIISEYKVMFKDVEDGNAIP